MGLRHRKQLCALLMVLSVAFASFAGDIAAARTAYASDVHSEATQEVTKSQEEAAQADGATESIAAQNITNDDSQAADAGTAAADGSNDANASADTAVSADADSVTADDSIENSTEKSAEESTEESAEESTELDEPQEASDEDDPDADKSASGTQATKLDSLKDGNVVALYYANGTSDGLILGSTAAKSKLEGVSAEASDDILMVPDEAAALTVSVDDNGYYTFSNDGKYLTTAAGGSSLSFAAAESDYSLWKVEKTASGSGFYIISVNAKYNNTVEQYLEYYNGFTTYSYKKANDAIYVFDFYLLDEGKPTVKVDTSITNEVAQWAGNANYDDAGVTAETGIKGDIYNTNDLLDADSIYTAVVNGQNVKPYMSATSSNTGSTNYYMGATGVGSGSDDYMQFALSSSGYANMKMSFRMRATNTAAGSFTLQYSTDGAAFSNFTTGTYSYKYTTYYKDSATGESTPKEITGDGAITDGVAKTSLAPTYYITFDFDVPEGASNAENLYIRMVPGTERAKGSGTPAAGGTIRIDSLVISGNPVVSSSVCGYVKASPASGTVTLGTELTLSSDTPGAEIIYSVNDGEQKLYSADNKPVIDALPMTVRAFAKADGRADSIALVYKYTQSQVATVKASPNGGAVAQGTRVNLTCETEGAVIQYSKDNGISWSDYDSQTKLVLNDLPATYLVRAVKENYIESSMLTLNYTLRENENYNIYFGQLHSHTSYSDGSGTCAEAYEHASNVENMEFLAVTDHSNSFDNAANASISDGSMSDEWTEGHELADKYTTSDFVSMFGYEMTWSNGLGHMNTFNTNGFQSRTQTAYSTYSTALQNYYTAIKSQPDSINQFNHPGTTFGDFSDFAYYDEELDGVITLIEVGNGEGTVGSSGYFPSYEYYQRALDKGWHVAPTNNQDNHKGLWGDANTARSVVLADSLTRENIYDAMRNYRIYATEDNDLNIYYTLDGYIMGSILDEGVTGDKVEIKVELSDATDAALGTVQVITNGGLVLATQQVTTNRETVTFTIDNKYSYYYIKVVEADSDIAVTAPVWVGAVEAAGINSISTAEVLPVKDESISVDLELYDNESTPLEIDSIEFMVGDDVIHTADLANAGFTNAGTADAPLYQLDAKSTKTYSFDYTYDKVGSIEIKAVVNAKLNGTAKKYEAVLKLTYVSPAMVTNVIIDGTHYNDYVTGYYGGNVGNFTAIAAAKNIKVSVVTDKITSEMLENCALLIVSAPAKKTGTANAGAYTPSHFEDSFIDMVKDYVDAGGTLIACGTADYQDSTNGQTATEMNKLLSAIGATTRINSDEAYDADNNGGQAYRLYLKGTYKEDSPYLAGASSEQSYSAYSGCTVYVDPAAEAAGTAEALVRGYDTTYSIDCKDEGGKTVSGSPVYVDKGNVVALAHETLTGGGNLFVAGTVFVSDFEVKAEQDNIWDLPYLNKTIVENILDEVTVELEATDIADVRANGQMGDVYSIVGYVTAGTDIEGNTFFDAIYLQDDTAGITIFPFAEAGVPIGTKIKITGYVDAYQGDKELQVLSYKILSDEETKVYDPEKMTAADAMDYEKSGGKLVAVEGKVVDILTDSSGSGISQFWIDDGSGTIGNIFIDGYIVSASTGKNTLASEIKVGDTVKAAGLVYAHPEGQSDVAVICLRVRNTDEIAKTASAPESGNGAGSGSGSGSGAGNGSGNITGNSSSYSLGNSSNAAAGAASGSVTTAGQASGGANASAGNQAAANGAGVTEEANGTDIENAGEKLADGSGAYDTEISDEEVPLGAEESKSSFKWWILLILLLMIAAYIYYQRKQEEDKI